MDFVKSAVTKTYSILTETVKKSIHLILGLFLYSICIQLSDAACPPVVDSDPDNYWIAGGGQNIWAPDSVSHATKSWAELAEYVQTSTNSAYAQYGWNLVLNGPTDGSKAPICYILYVNGAVEPPTVTSWGNPSCGAYFYPMAWGTKDDGTPLRCPGGYNMSTSDGRCYINDPQLKVCPDPKKEPNPPDYCGTGNPINQANGVKYAEEIDISRTSNFGLEMKRFYSHAKDGTTLRSRFGYAWSHTYNRHLIFKTEYGVAMPTTVVVYRDDGKGITYRLSNGVYISTSDEENMLIKNVNGWTYTDNKKMDSEYYDNNGKLLQIIAISGLNKVITYSDSNNNKYPATAPDCSASLPVGTLNAPNSIRCITNEIGAQLNFAYDSTSRIKNITDPAGASYTYLYDDTIGSNSLQNNTQALLTVIFPENKQRSYIYNGVVYTPMQYALTGIVDENNSRFATYIYDTNGRAISTEHGTGIEKFSINYVTNSANNVLYSTVTDPLGSVRTHNFDTVLGTIKSTGQSQPSGSGCSAAASALTYDANGNIASRTDFKGNMTTYVYDMARNLETSRTEGLTSTGATTTATRTITTTWHPTWRLPLATSEYTGATATGTALHTTTNVYDTKGNITSISEADPARALTRTTTITYTYSTAVPGLIITKVVNGPRTDVTDTTTYNYYDANTTCTPSAALPIVDPITGTSPANLGCRGQLQSMTNALGKTTQFNRYNHHGQVEQMTDANGVVTTNTYDLRQRLLSHKLGNETTSLAYDNVGQVIQLTMADASTLNYTYDAAHRLTQIQDTVGNKVTYTLDAAGNRTNEVTTDPLGNLAKTLTRSYDALNRLQQMTGVQ
jgi:YD repeat-containing protein